MDHIHSRARMVSKGAVQLSPECELVTDADEEVFILYSEKQLHSESQSTESFRGLGYVDSHKDLLQISFELKNVVAPENHVEDIKRSKRRKAAKELDRTIEVELYQDKTALRSRKGDTGSVVWKASVDFAQLVLQNYYSNSSQSLLNHDMLNSQHILELGAGTGLLSIALSPLVRRYTATDIGPLIPLIKKNVALNFPGWPKSTSGALGTNVSVEELDWIVLEKASARQRTKTYSQESQPIDLLLAVDCLYHPSLIPPFVAALDYLATPGRTAVLVVSELRAEDVMREFLEAWLSKEGWEIWRIPNDTLGKHYVIWLGWKTGSS